MKKLTKIMLSFVLCFMMAITFSACKDAEIESASVKTGTLETTVDQFDEVDTSNVVIIVKYDNGETKEVSSDKLNFSAIDTSSAGEKTLTITYEKFSFDVVIIVEAEVIAPKDITSVIIEGLSDKVAKGSNIDLSTKKIKVTFDDETFVETYVGVDALLSISELNTATLGVKEIVVTYNTKTFTISVEVVEPDELKEVASLSSKLLTDYNANIKEQTNKQIEFNDKEQPIYVGDDNEFNLRFEVLDENLEDIQYFANIVKVEIEEVDPQDETKTIFTELTGTELSNMVEVGRYATFNFTEQAIGKNFKLTVTPKLIAEGFEDFTTVVAIVSVVDGYNVYTAKELSVYDNTNEGWNEIKEELGLKDLQVNAIILQNDILVTKDDVRSDIFWTKDTTGYAVAQAKTDQVLEGTPRDDAGSIYNRKVASGSTFNFIGNYFSVDLSTFPKMVVEWNGQESGHKGVKSEEGSEQIMTGHFATFITENDNITAETQVNWKNLYFVGNGALTANPVDSGAILLMKNKYVNFNSYNTLTHNFYITYFMELGNKDNALDGKFVIDSCKAYNSYQTLVYAWGAENMIIKNSEFKNAGGPAIITDHAHSDDENGGNPTHLDIINSVIESKVTGKEPWFNYYGASTLVGELVMADAFYNGYYASLGLPATGKSIIAGIAMENGNPIPQLNIAVVMKSGNAEGLTVEPINGYTRFFKTEQDYNKHYGLNGETQEVTTYGLDMDKTDGLESKALGQYHYFESNGNGGYINSGFGTANQDSSIMSGVSHAVGDYINLYLANGMGAVIGFYNAA